jgi:hypothetical protein
MEGGAVATVPILAAEGADDMLIGSRTLLVLLLVSDLFQFGREDPSSRERLLRREPEEENTCGR